MTYYAHTAPTGEWQRLRNHLLGVANGARSRTDKFGAGVWGEAAGLLHDLGKYSAEFQARLNGDPTPVDHSTAGAQVARQRYNIGGNLLAAGIAGHHAGLANGTATGERTPLATRLVSPVPDYSAWQREITLPPTLPPPRLAPHPTAGRSRAGLQLATLSRMIFGALVDADWTDTTAFYNGSYVEPDAPSLETLRDSLDSFSTSFKGPPHRRGSMIFAPASFRLHASAPVSRVAFLR
jgi:CRISPR-associated endonuclease/helicase Cas3